jgi:hypothetical protein
MRRPVPSLGLVLVLAGPWGCGEERTPAPVMEDAGPGCLRGTQSCLCTLEDGCESGLLCIANRCLSLEGDNTGGTASEPVRPPSSTGGSGAGGGSGAAGGSAGGGGTSGDASAPDAAAGNGGATDAAAPPADASVTDASL